MARRAGFHRELALAGWASGSAWGWDEVFECYWADLRGPGGAARIGPEGLLVTLGALSGAVATVTGCEPEEAYLALTA